jgi:hypothetical protein
MRKLAVTLALIAGLGLMWASLAEAQPTPAVTKDATAPTAAPDKPTPPEDIKDAAGKVGEVIKDAKAGRWWHMASVICMLIMFGLAKFGVFEKIGRWKYGVLPLLAIGSAILATFQGGVSIDVAAEIFFSSWATGMLEEAWNHGIMGKGKSKPVAT